MRWRIRVRFLMMAVACLAAAQTPAPKFDVVSIHELQAPYRVLGQRTVSGSRIRLEGYTVGMLVAEAYGKKPYETATPPPKHFAYFSVDARAPGEDAPEPAALEAMLRNMLAERFHLKAHTEMRNVPIYALVVSKGGPRLKAGTGEEPCRQKTGPVTPADRNYRHSLENCPMDRFVPLLGAGRPVIDKTGLTGLYDISIAFTPDFRMKGEVQPADITIEDSIHQLGLQMEKSEEPMEIVVVDSYDDLPSGN
jgi:uncharacterized protein (TIGR03435 family)